MNPGVPCTPPATGTGTGKHMSKSTNLACRSCVGAREGMEGAVVQGIAKGSSSFVCVPFWGLQRCCSPWWLQGLHSREHRPQLHLSPIQSSKVALNVIATIHRPSIAIPLVRYDSPPTPLPRWGIVCPVCSLCLAHIRVNGLLVCTTRGWEGMARSLSQTVGHTDTGTLKVYDMLCTCCPPNMAIVWLHFR